MIHPSDYVVLASGEAVSLSELAEAFDLFAANEASWPALSERDRLKARVELAFILHTQLEMPPQLDEGG